MSIDEQINKLAEDGRVYTNLAACFGVLQTKYQIIEDGLFMEDADKAELRKSVVHLAKVAKNYFKKGKPNGPFGAKIWTLLDQVSTYLKNFSNTSKFLEESESAPQSL